MGTPAKADPDIMHSVAKGLASDPDAAAARSRALSLIAGSAKFLRERYGPHAAAGALYCFADEFACQPDNKETRT